MRTRWQLALVCAALPLLAAAQDDEPSYIVPPDAPPPASIFTTHQNPNTSTLPWKKTEPPAAAPPPAAPSTYKPNDTVPFGHASSSVSQPIPAGPRMMQAVPVPGVDAIEVTTPAAPQPETPQVNPAAENPAVPTGATSPIFPDRPVLPPRKIIVRVLNKVTGRAETLEGKPGEVIRFGVLDIQTVTCEASTPESQLDYAGLLDIREHAPGQTKDVAKPLFRGWMYASSPSVSSLEHPIYDVTMVECKPAEEEKPAPKKEDAPAKKKK